MIQGFHRILVPLDGSGLAESVLPLTKLLADKMGSEITLLHIIEQKARASVHGEPHLTTSLGADNYLDEVAGRLGGNVRIKSHVHGTEEQDVAVSIASHAMELDADLIALCTHGRSDPRRVVFGSIAQQVLRRVQVPVLLVRPESSTPERLQTILVPLDGSHEGEYAYPVATAIARACQANLHMVRIVPTVASMKGDNQAAARLTPITAAAALDVEEFEAQSYLAKQVEQMASEGIQASAQVLRGDVVQAIAEVAVTRNTDLTVMATHGRSGLGTFWIGSVAAGLVNKLHQPLILVKVRE